ncbi:MAG: TonB family protein [Vicinamibacterales bacterium]
MIMRVRPMALVSLVGVLLVAAPAHAQDRIAAARELYASAQYDEALEVLGRLSAEAPSTDRQSIDLYRTLCLFAVGRRDEANRTIEAIIARDPLYRPGDDLSPRTQTAFSDARKRLLPAIVQQQYAEAKGAFDRKEYEAAATAFARVLAALEDRDIGPSAQQPPLSDLRTLAAGFRDLSVRAIPPPPPPPPPAPPRVPVNLPPRIYSGGEGVRPPVTIAQDLPRYPGPVPTTGFKGLVEVVINEAGAVESAAMVVSVGNTYDKLLLAAASRWQFVPAMVEGAPVKFRKRVQVNIAPAKR